MGRFINADAYTTTDKGLVGNNLFVYCNGNPIMYLDFNGNEPTYAIDTDGDGIEDCFVYEYTYTYLIQKQMVTLTWDITGSVYFYTGKSREDMEHIVYPEGFNSTKDLLIADLTKAEETLYAYQAQKVNSRYHSNVIDCMLQYDRDFNTTLNRTAKSLNTEWKSHNPFAMFDASAQNVDFDNAEEGKNFGYYVKKAFFRAIEKFT